MAGCRARRPSANQAKANSIRRRACGIGKGCLALDSCGASPMQGGEVVQWHGAIATIFFPTMMRVFRAQDFFIPRQGRCSSALRRFMDDYGEKWLWRSIYLICLVFLVFFVIVQWNNRINNSDEFFFLERLRGLGVLRSVIEWEYNQRPVSYLLFNLTFSLNDRVETLRWPLLISGIVFLLLFTHSFKLALSKLFHFVNIDFGATRSWAFSFLLVMCTFFFVFERPEIWFWHICFVIYMLPFLFLVYGLFLLFETSNLRWFSLLFFFLIGGCLELLILMTGCILIMLFLNRRITFLTMIASGSSLLALSILQFFNDGIETRMQMEARNAFLYNSDISTVFIHLFDAKNVFFVLLACLIIAVLRPYKERLSVLPFRRILWQYAMLLAAFFVITWVVARTVFPGSFGLLRMWAPFSIFLLFFLLLGAANASLKANRYLVRWIAIAAASCFLMLFSAFMHRQVRLTTDYARQYDRIVKNGHANGEEAMDPGVLSATGDLGLLLEFLRTWNDHEK